jgi:hypothetical protein
VDKTKKLKIKNFTNLNLDFVQNQFDHDVMISIIVIVVDVIADLTVVLTH